MATCKVCGKEYHACSSCDLRDWEYSYCCTDCWDREEEHIKDLNVVMHLLDSLTKEQLLSLDRLGTDERGQRLIDLKIEEGLKKV